MFAVIVSIQTVMDYLFWGILFIGLSGIITYSVLEEKQLKGETLQLLKWCRNQKSKFFD